MVGRVPDGTLVDRRLPRPDLITHETEVVVLRRGERHQFVAPMVTARLLEVTEGQDGLVLLQDDGELVRVVAADLHKGFDRRERFGVVDRKLFGLREAHVGQRPQPDGTLGPPELQVLGIFEVVAERSDGVGG